MKHAFIITAYCDFEALCRQLTEYAAYFDCYVHIDKKSRVPAELMQKLKEIPNVRLIQKYKINWGGVQHVYAILSLLRMAEASGKNYGYYHIMSANSLLIQKPSDFCAFFEKNRGKNFVELSKRISEMRRSCESAAVIFTFSFFITSEGDTRPSGNALKLFPSGFRQRFM